MGPIPGRQQGWIGRHHPKGEPAAVEPVPLAIDPIKNLQAPEAMLLGQRHRSSLGSDRQTGPAAAAAGPDHPASRMGAHPNAETRYPFPFAAGALQSALGHVTFFSATHPTSRP
jgi:hypothetical protein